MPVINVEVDRSWSGMIRIAVRRGPNDHVLINWRWSLMRFAWTHCGIFVGLRLLIGDTAREAEKFMTAIRDDDAPPEPFVDWLAERGLIQL